jgi:hypothetical protein
MSDNLAIEPNLFYNQESEINNESDNPSEPENVVNDEPEETIKEESEVVETEEEAETEESEESESGDFILTIGDEDITEEMVLSWRQAHEDRKSMQADYTRKQQARAEEVKKQVSEITEKELSEISALKSVLEELVTGEDKDLDELLEYDTSEYIKEKERREKRAKALDKARKLTTKNTQVTEEKATEVHNELIEVHNSDWVKDGNFTDAYKKDMDLLSNYVKSNGFTAEEYHNSFNVKSLDAMIKAAKYDEHLKGEKKTKAKLKPVMKAKKSKAKQEPVKDKSLTDYFYNT